MNDVDWQNKPKHAGKERFARPNLARAWCWRGLVLLGFWASQTVMAAPGDPLADLTAFLCTIFDTLSGGFGVALSLVVLGIGLLLLALGARGALSRIGVGVVAVAGLVTLPTLFVSLFPSTAGTVCGI